MLFYTKQGAVTMDLTEKKLSSREVYRGRIVNVHMDEVSLPN